MKVMLAVFQLDKRGGKERDCVAIARDLARRGHDVTILAASANLADFSDLHIVVVPVTGFTNHTRARRFAGAVQDARLRERPDVLLAFERIPGADFFYAADATAILRKPSRLSSPFRRQSHLALEREVLSALSQTHVFFVTARQRDEYVAAYGLDPSRATVLPMILHDDRFEALPSGSAAPDRTSGEARDSLRAVSIAVNPKLKGVDRTLEALLAFPQVNLVIMGARPRWLLGRVARLGLGGRVQVLPYSSDVMQAIIASDFMIHPARSEAAGLVIGEALLAGVPAVVSGLCGYAAEIEASGAGIVLAEPFQQAALVTAIAHMIASLPGMRKAAVEQSQRIRRQRGAWLSTIAERIERLG